LLADRLIAINKCKEITIEIVTNGVLLTPENLKAFAGIKHPLHFNVSLDSSNPFIYSSIRSHKNLGRVIHNIASLKKRTRELDIKNTQLSISMVMMKRNILGLMDFVSLGYDLGCDSVGVSHLTIFDQEDSKESLFWFPSLTNEIIAKARNRAKLLGLTFNAPPAFATEPDEIQHYLQSEVRICPYLEGRIYIGHDGRLEACCHSQRPIMGNLSDESLSKIWYNDKYKRYHVSLFSGSPIEPCNSCYILEHYKPFLHDSKPFGLDVPVEQRRRSTDLDFIEEGFFDCFKELDGSDLMRHLSEKHKVEIERIRAILASNAPKYDQLRDSDVPTNSAPAYGTQGHNDKEKMSIPRYLVSKLLKRQ
jgi:radical SAM protein with 4Fe4S-binding SPASM domain